MKGFKEFLLRGNVMDLAVAVVIGAAFTAIVSSVVENVFTPLIGAIFNAKDLAATGIVRIPLTAGVAELKFGAVLASAITFLITALVVYFVFIVPMNALLKRAFQQKAQAPASTEPAPPTELDLLAQIRDLLEDRQQVGDQRILKQD